MYYIVFVWGLGSIFLCMCYIEGMFLFDGDRMCESLFYILWGFGFFVVFYDIGLCGERFCVE